MRKTVLLADDSSTIRKIVELALRETEIHVEAVASGAEALARLEALRPDLVLADVAMPEPSGYELCRRVKGSAHPVPVVLLAGAFEVLDRELYRACGADDELIKPFDSAALREKVRRLLGDASIDPATPLPQSDDRAAIANREALERAAREVVERLAADVLREVAREVLPAVAAEVVRERIRELERDGD